MGRRRSAASIRARPSQRPRASTGTSKTRGKAAFGSRIACKIGSMPNIGPLEIVVILIIALIVFGPKRLPELGRSMGKGIREFKSSLSGDKDDEDDVRELERAPRETAVHAEEAPLEGEVVHERRT